jgi:hypothetical protein
MLIKNEAVSSTLIKRVYALEMSAEKKALQAKIQNKKRISILST